MEFFEIKVIKVKKEKDRTCFHWSISKPYMCGICGKTVKAIETIRKKGNWVNGENIDKIKFPCFCSFSDPTLKDYCYGMIINEGYFKSYILVEIKISGQSSGNMVRDKKDSIKELINYWDIHILKGKILIFKEEK